MLPADSNAIASQTTLCCRSRYSFSPVYLRAMLPASNHALANLSILRALAGQPLLYHCQLITTLSQVIHRFAFTIWPPCDCRPGVDTPSRLDCRSDPDGIIILSQTLVDADLETVTTSLQSCPPLATAATGATSRQQTRERNHNCSARSLDSTVKPCPRHEQGPPAVCDFSLHCKDDTDIKKVSLFNNWQSNFINTVMMNYCGISWRYQIKCRGKKLVNFEMSCCCDDLIDVTVTAVHDSGCFNNHKKSNFMDCRYYWLPWCQTTLSGQEPQQMAAKLKCISATAADVLTYWFDYCVRPQQQTWCRTNNAKSCTKNICIGYCILYWTSSVGECMIAVFDLGRRRFFFQLYGSEFEI